MLGLGKNTLSDLSKDDQNMKLKESKKKDLQLQSNILSSTLLQSSKSVMIFIEFQNQDGTNLNHLTSKNENNQKKSKTGNDSYHFRER